MKKYLLIAITALNFVIPNLHAESRSTLFLRAYVPSSITTNITESKLSSTQSLWTFSSQINSRYAIDGQKFEVIGLDQVGVEAHVKKVVGSDRSIQFEVLINLMKTNNNTDKPIFLKISAN